MRTVKTKWIAPSTDFAGSRTTPYNDKNQMQLARTLIYWDLVEQNQNFKNSLSNHIISADFPPKKQIQNQKSKRSAEEDIMQISKPNLAEIVGEAVVIINHNDGTILLRGGIDNNGRCGIRFRHFNRSFRNYISTTLPQHRNSYYHSGKKKRER